MTDNDTYQSVKESVRSPKDNYLEGNPQFNRATFDKKVTKLLRRMTLASPHSLGCMDMVGYNEKYGY